MDMCTRLQQLKWEFRNLIVGDLMSFNKDKVLDPGWSNPSTNRSWMKNGWRALRGGIWDVHG